MKKERIVRMTLEEALAQPSKSDWAKIAATTDADIERQIAEDPDLQGFDEEIDWSKAVFVDAPGKKPISIRLDQDILAYFRAQGGGYQSRINKVLRHYMESTIKRPAKDAAE
jgi:uncharacterized protein (DUF4415 family)